MSGLAYLKFLCFDVSNNPNGCEIARNTKESPRRCELKPDVMLDRNDVSLFSMQLFLETVSFVCFSRILPSSMARSLKLYKVWRYPKIIAHRQEIDTSFCPSKAFC